MRFSKLNDLLLSMLAARSITAAFIQPHGRDLEVIDITRPPVDEADQKRGVSNHIIRDLKVVDITPPPVDTSDDKSDILPRSYNIGHCGVNGGQWMPLVAVNFGEYGFNDAAAAFCNHFDGTVIPSKGSVSALVQSTGGSVLRLTGGAIGHFQGTIYCHKHHVCTIAAATCTEYVQAIGASDGGCYGENNMDTKGGRNDLSDSYYDGTPLQGAQTKA